MDRNIELNYEISKQMRNMKPEQLNMGSKAGTAQKLS